MTSKERFEYLLDKVREEINNPTLNDYRNLSDDSALFRNLNEWLEHTLSVINSKVF